MKRVLRVQRQAADLRAVLLQGPRDAAGFAAIPIQAETAQFGGGELDGVPFEDERGLGRVAAAQGGCAGRDQAEGGVDVGLQPGEGERGAGFGGEVAGDGDVDDGAGGYVRREEDGGEFYL